MLSSPCAAALDSVCPRQRLATVRECDACVGDHQATLRGAGCSSAEVQRWCSAPRTPGLVNITNGTVVLGLGAHFGGGDTHCRRSVNAPDCSTAPRQLIGANDFATDPTGRHLYVATSGLDSIGQCPSGKSGAVCRDVRVHDNSSRLLVFDLKDAASEPVTLSYCGPWAAVEFDARRGQVVALRHVNLQTDFHGTHYAAEVVTFAANSTRPASDSSSTSCYNRVPITSTPGTCACAMGFDPDNLNGRVIGRRGLKTNGILPPATMALLGDSVLVGDQNQHCVLSFPLDGSAGATSPGTPVAGTCGQSCGRQGCASIGSPAVLAGKELGDGSHGQSLVYTMFTTPDGKLLLNDMNSETIDYGARPQAETEFRTAPVDPKGSSLYRVPVIDPNSRRLLLQEKFSMGGQLLTPTAEGGYGDARVVLPKQSLLGWYLDKSINNSTVMTPVQGVPLQWAFTPAQGATKVLALIGLAYTGGSSFLDYAFLELTF
jgi:hypothetical protein